MAPDSASDWWNVSVSALAAIATLVALVVVIIDSRRANRRADAAEEALATERNTEVAEQLAAFQAEKVTATAEWVRGPFHDDELTGDGPHSVQVGDLQVRIDNQSNDWVLDVETFVCPPLRARPDLPRSKAANSVWANAVHVPVRSTDAEALLRNVVQEDWPGEFGPELELHFTDRLGNRWRRDFSGALTLTRRAAVPVSFRPELNVDPGWRATTPNLRWD